MIMKNKPQIQSVFNDIKMHKISNRTYLTSISKTLTGRPVVPIIPIIMGLLISPIAHADDIADLINLKTQHYSQTSSSQTNFPNEVTPQVAQVALEQGWERPWQNKSSNASATVNIRSPLSSPKQSFYANYATAPNINEAHIETLYTAEQYATPSARQVLQMVRQMALDNKEIIRGSCWDYLNAAFSRAGVARNTIFKGEYPYGPFVNTNEIEPGDWLYYVNHSYNDVEHSGLFVGWLNRETNEALILSYAGESRQEPARYKSYDISHTYNIIRPGF